jgi:hypothetical protein
MTQHERATQVWQVLANCAHERRSITYELLGETIDMGGAGVFGSILGDIMYWCLQHDKPALTVLVVQKHSGVPGDGLTTIDGDINHEREHVFATPWLTFLPPTAKEFQEAWTTGENAA